VTERVLTPKLLAKARPMRCRSPTVSICCAICAKPWSMSWLVMNQPSSRPFGDSVLSQLLLLQSLRLLLRIQP